MSRLSNTGKRWGGRFTNQSIVVNSDDRCIVGDSNFKTFEFFDDVVSEFIMRGKKSDRLVKLS